MPSEINKIIFPMYKRQRNLNCKQTENGKKEPFPITLYCSLSEIITSAHLNHSVHNNHSFYVLLRLMRMKITSMYYARAIIKKSDIIVPYRNGTLTR